MLKLLERRLDNLVYKAGFGATIWAARQLVVHGHILVDGKRLDLPSYEVKPGQVIEVRDRMRRNAHLMEWVDQVGAYPPYLDVKKGQFSATLLRIPEDGEVQAPVDIQMVVEYYNRLT
jgi:small subunit ribosomal protein S4